MSTKLSLRIHRVKCVDETGGTWAEKFGNDEIYLGGFATDDVANTVQIAPVSIYADFDDGDVKTFNPPKVFHTFNLNAGTEWPKGFGVGLILIEKDAGGMSSAVKSITDFAAAKIKEELQKEKQKRTAMASASDAGGTATLVALSPLVILAIKAAAPYIIDFIARKILSAFADEIFQTQVVTLELRSKDFTWAGAKDSAEKTVRFNNHGGIYDLTYDWQLA